jgi:CBS domain containing-hemolysin-like protein
MIGVRLLAILALVLINGFFAATEFALVAVRLSRVRQLVEQGNARARVVLGLLGRLDRVVSGVQVGITLTSLGLGALGELTLAALLRPMLDWLPGRPAVIVLHATSLALAFALLTVLHVVLGELVPKSVSLQRAEKVALLVAVPFAWYLRTFRWAIDMLDGASRVILRGLGLGVLQSHTVARSAEELEIQIRQARERGLLAPGEEKFLLNAIQLGQLRVGEIMVPRPDMHVLPIESGLEDVLRMFATTQRSRIPVYEGTVDHLAGYVHIKDMLWVLLDRQRRAEEEQALPAFDLRRVLRDIPIVPESKPAAELLSELRVHRAGIAAVVDEYGSILGLVTLEDLLEQVVGEIHDEFDVVERPQVVGHGPDAAMIFDASLPVRDLERQYNIALPEDPAYATVGGFVLSQLQFIPRGGESFEYGGYRFTVIEMDRRRVARVKIERLKLAAAEAAAGEGAAPGAERVSSTAADAAARGPNAAGLP